MSKQSYPEFQFLSQTSVLIDKSAADIIKSLQSENVFSQLLIFKNLFRLKKIGLPSSLNEQATSGSQFTLLDYNQYNITLGLTGKFWNWDPELLKLNKNDFIHFKEKTYTRILWNFHAKHLPQEQTRLFLKLYINHTDKKAKTKFAQYWKTGRYISFIARQLLLYEIKTKLN